MFRCKAEPVEILMRLAAGIWKNLWGDCGAMADRYTADYWRRCAAEAELALSNTIDPTARMSLHAISAGYLAMARHAERREQRSQFSGSTPASASARLHSAAARRSAGGG
jgi:hypothetical protein